MLPNKHSSGFRAACGACHKRKIRCQRTVSNERCQACVSYGRECLVVPRLRVGRPSHSTSSGEQSICSQGDNPTELPPVSENEESASSGSEQDTTISGWPNLNSEDDLDLIHTHLLASDLSQSAYEHLSPVDSGQVNIGIMDYAIFDVNRVVTMPRSTACEATTVDEPYGPLENPLPIPWQNSVKSTFSDHSNHNINNPFSVLLQACGDVQAIQLNLDDYESPPTAGDSHASTRLLSCLQSIENVIQIIRQQIWEFPGINPDNSLCSMTLPTLAAIALLRVLALYDATIHFLQLRIKSKGWAKILHATDYNIVEIRTIARKLERRSLDIGPLLRRISESGSSLREKIRRALDQFIDDPDDGIDVLAQVYRAGPERGRSL